MRFSKLDISVFIIVLACLAALVIAAYVNDPSRQPIRVAYLYPATAGAQNVWLAEIDNAKAQQQLTFSKFGVYDFDFSADGNWLAYGDRTEAGLVTLRLLDMRSRESIDLADCAVRLADCRSPAFSPDGGTLAYQRSNLENGAYQSAHIWLVDMHSPSYETVPLIDDPHAVGHSPVWSADGQRIAFYSADEHEAGIVIVDVASLDGGELDLHFIASSHGTMGALAPDGQRIVFPEVVRRGERLFSHLRIADLQNKVFADFSDPEGPVDDVTAQWSPTSETVALARKYTDARWTAGHQLYLRSTNPSETTLTPIVYDERYNTSYFRWNAAGDRLVLQRFPMLDDSESQNQPAQPEVWVYALESDSALMIVENAFLPQWVGG